MGVWLLTRGLDTDGISPDGARNLLATVNAIFCIDFIVGFKEILS